MNKDDIKNKIVSANSAYRSGTPIMSDQAFDDLCDEYQKLVSEDEWNVFRDTLHEAKGKVKHPFTMGSLDKLKAEEPEVVKKWIKENIKTAMSVSAKVDGISSRAEYRNGKLVSLTTRGDGYLGMDITSKAKYIKGLPETLPRYTTYSFTGSIRGELVILKNYFELMKDKYANPRNACAGIMNRKDGDKKFNENELRCITFVPYTILGDGFDKETQFRVLENLGFIPARNFIIKKSDIGDDIVDILFDEASSNDPYETDGLVICDSKWRNEDKYRPDGCKAFKINQLVAETTVIDVVFEGPSKHGVFCPVAILDPVELGGATISRCSLYNLDFINKMGIKYGSKVKLMRSGDVIPKIIEVLSSDNKLADIIAPTECPICGSKLILDGVNMKCCNDTCGDKLVHQTVDFIKRLGVKSASEASLKKFGINCIADLVKFQANPKYKSEKKLESELLSKVFARSKTALLAAMPFEDLGETLINKIVDFYGYDNIEARKQYVGLPDGVGDITLQKFKDRILDNLKLVNMFINDSRYNHLEDTHVSMATSQKNGMSVCFTGKLETMSRSKASELAEANGFEVKGGVSRDLTYLVTNDTQSGSSKNRKAKEFGTKVISEAEFLRLCNGSETDLDSL